MLARCSARGSALRPVWGHPSMRSGTLVVRAAAGARACSRVLRGACRSSLGLVEAGDSWPFLGGEQRPQEKLA